MSLKVVFKSLYRTRFVNYFRIEIVLGRPISISIGVAYHHEKVALT